MRWVVLLLLLGGCDLVLSIEQRRFVEVEVLQRAHVNDATGAPAVEDVAFDSGLEVRVLDLDGNVLPVTAVDATRFQFAADGTYRVVITDTLLGDTAEYQLANDRARIVRPMLGRRDAVAGGASAKLNVTLASVPPGGLMRVVTTGVFGSYMPATAEPNENFTVPWSGAPLVDTARGDRLLVLHFKLGSQGTDVLVGLDGMFDARPLQMAADGVSTVAGTFQGLATDRCARVTLPRADELARLAGVWGRPTPIVASSTILSATLPRADLHGGIGLAGAVTMQSTLPTNATIDFTYADPFTQYPDRIVVMQTQAYSMVTTGTKMIPSGVETRVVVPLTAGCTSATVANTRVAIAEQIAVRGALLDADDQEVRVDRAGQNEVTWTVTEGVDGAYIVQLYRVTEAGALQLVRTLVTNTRTAYLDERDLGVGETYALLVGVLAGTTRGGDGELVMDGLDSNSLRWSRTFTIEN